MTQIIATDGGPHTADTWASIIAGQIVEHEHLDGDKLIKAQLLKAEVAEALLPHISFVQSLEQANLAADASHILSALEADVTGALAAVLAKLQASQWASQFGVPAVHDAVQEIIQRGMNTVAHIERLWHADRNPADPAVQQFKGA